MMEGHFYLCVICLVMSAAVAVQRTGCSCVKSNYDCGCCADIKISQIKLDNNVCVNATYLPKDYGISLTFSIDGKVFINETISARNPPPICVDVPHLKELASICIDFYNLDISKGHFSGCIELEARLYHVLVEKVKLGCFHVGTVVQDWVTIAQEHLDKGVQMLKEMQMRRMEKMSKINNVLSLK